MSTGWKDGAPPAVRPCTNHLTLHCLIVFMFKRKSEEKKKKEISSNVFHTVILSINAVMYIWEASRVDPGTQVVTQEMV